MTEKRPSKSGLTHKKRKKVKGHFSNPVKESAIVGHSAFFNTLFFSDPTFVLFFCSPFEDGKARMFVDESNFPEADSSFNRIRKQTFDQSKAHSNMDFYAPQKLREIIFGHFEAPKNCHFDHFSSSEFDFLGTFDIFNCEIFPKIKTQSLQNC